MRTDLLSIIGILISFVAILGGQQMEGGDFTSIINAISFFIVIGGTLGAVMLQTPWIIFIRALRITQWIFTPPLSDPEEILSNLISWNKIARKEGLIRLEFIALEQNDFFCRKGLQLIADGTSPYLLREMLEADLDIQENYDISAAKVYEAMGGYAPTIGIIGAVMGLIHVMDNLADPAALGPGIAVAFVSTIYGVGFANLFFIPISQKLKAIITHRSHTQAMLIEGFSCIADGNSSHLLKTRLYGYLNQYAS